MLSVLQREMVHLLMQKSWTNIQSAKEAETHGESTAGNVDSQWPRFCLLCIFLTAVNAAWSSTDSNLEQSCICAGVCEVRSMSHWRRKEDRICIWGIQYKIDLVSPKYSTLRIRMALSWVLCSVYFSLNQSQSLTLYYWPNWAPHFCAADSEKRNDTHLKPLNMILFLA